MKGKNIKREAAVLLFATLMMFSSWVVIADTNNHLGVSQSTPATPVNPAAKSGLVWDNVVGVHGALGGIIVSVLRPDGDATPADDFMFDEPKQIDSVFWQGGYFQCELAQGFKDYGWNWNVIFWSDDGAGDHPASEIYNHTIYNSSIDHSLWYTWTNVSSGREYWVANYSAQLPVPITFNANTKYWITIQGIGAYPPQACWTRHNNSVGGIKLHESVFKGVLWLYPNWVNLSVLAPDHLPHDLNFQLFGGDVPDTTPPYTTITLNGTMSGGVYTTPVKVTLSAIDNISGVNYTMYKVDSGALTLYNGSFMVTAEGNHTITYYSVDRAGNKETNKTATFTIQFPIQIAIKGGFGITATIKNTGTTILNNISYKIQLTGGTIIIGKKPKTGTITTLAPAQESKVKDIVFGFGKTTIMATAGDASKETTGTVFLFFVLGVK